jgi:bacterioferritin-associated ferredoxin
MLVCLCHPASERQIESCIQEGARSVEDIGEMCGAGTGCGACRDELRECLERAGFGDDADRAGVRSDPPAGCPGGLVSLRSRQAA